MEDNNKDEDEEMQWSSVYRNDKDYQNKNDK